MTSWLPSLLSPTKKTLESTSDVTLTVNGTSHTVPANLDPETKLVDYLRNHLHLTGTKFMCREGTCGSCVVNINFFNPTFKEMDSISANASIFPKHTQSMFHENAVSAMNGWKIQLPTSYYFDIGNSRLMMFKCLLPVYACAGLDVTTVEGIGDRLRGYHPVQERLADYNGSQCGFCSPGMVMAMYSLLKKQEFPHEQDIEDLLDGNICRCTGYRSILAAMQSFSGNINSQQLLQTLLCKSKCGKEVNGKTDRKCSFRPLPISRMIRLQVNDTEWFRPMDLDELYGILKDLDDGRKIRMVVGDTSSGIFPDEGPYDANIDTKGIQEFYQYNMSKTEVVVGANVSLNDFIEILERLETNASGFVYSGAVAQHIKKVANNNVRNVGCWAGNLMIKKYHRDFPSDIFTLMETVGANITLAHYDGRKQILSPLELLTFDMKGWVILHLQLKGLTSNHHFSSFKIMPRNQGSQAYVNAAFLMEVDDSDNWRVSSKPSIVYGGISGNFIHAIKTENYLNGKNLGDPKILQESLSLLSEEIVPDPKRILGSVQYRKRLAINLYYKYVLGVLPKAVSSRIKSGADILERPISSGTQTFDTNKLEWPLNKPIPKIEAKSQCAGEVEYVFDIPRPPHTLYGVFVISTIGNAYIENIDASKALELPGVVRCLTSKDIPGENDIYPDPPIMNDKSKLPEELFSSGRVLYAGQPLALIVADTFLTAKNAAKMVEVTYKDEHPPVVSLEEAIKNPPPPIPEDIDSEIHIGDAEAALKTAPNTIKGEVKMGSQYHLHMETQVALCIPEEDGIDMAVSTQYMEAVQQAAARILKMRKSSFNIQVRRLGGGFGGKITRCLYVSTACALACHLTNKPVFIQWSLPTNLEAVGKRNSFIARYEVGFDNNGKLEAVKVQYFLDPGCYPNESDVQKLPAYGKNAYDCPNWSLVPRTVITNLPANTWVRAPSVVNTIFVIEVVMEHIAKYLKKNPMDIKYLNLNKSLQMKGQIVQSNIRDIYTQLRKDAGVDQRLKDIEEFNANNRWMKRGLSIVPMEYNLIYVPLMYSAIVSIYKDGGTVSIAHGGIDMGQGINTKVVQVCAYELGIPIDLISVKPTNTLTNPNGAVSATSVTSELNCKAVMDCCQILLKRMEPIKQKLKNPTWEELVDECFKNGVDLSARHMYGPAEKPHEYPIYGATCAEVELDVLTGQNQIKRVDIIYDCGQSISPLVDIGQIEGAFVMGLGLFLIEQVKHDSKTGQALTNRLWEYFVPSSKDIPIDFRVTLLKNSPNPYGVLKSKASGEPPLCMSSSALFAIQSAIDAARAETGDVHWAPLHAPATAEAVQLSCHIKNEDLVYN